MKTLAGLRKALGRDGIAHEVVRAGDAWMLVAPSLAARVLGAGIGEENLLWTAGSFSPAPQAHFPARGWAAGGNAGGARTWIAPEGGPHGFFYPDGGDSWDVPPGIDPGSYTAVPGAPGWTCLRTSFTARAPDGAAFPLLLTRCLRIEADPGLPGLARIRIRQVLENAGTAPVDGRASPWCIVQVPSEAAGTIAMGLRAGLGLGRESMAPYFGTGNAIRARASGAVLLVKAQGGSRWKLGIPAPAAAGTIAFARPSRLVPPPVAPSRLESRDAWTSVCLRFAVDPAGSYLEKSAYGPGEPAAGDAVQAYNDPGTADAAFSEIEAHAPAAPIPPGGKLEAEVEMRIASGGIREILAGLAACGLAGLTPSDLSW